MAQKFPLVLITGASGFIGSHVVEQAIEAGYPVRLTARPQKVEQLSAFYAGRPNVDVAPIEDVATGDYSNALKGVGAVIHVAAPLSNSAAGQAGPKAMLSGAVEGTLNIVRQAAAAGAKRIVVTSSMAATIDVHDDFYTNKILSEKDWNVSTLEELLDGSHDSDRFWVYAATKTIAERKLWEFADAHPDVDITTILPPMVYGPLVKGAKVEKGGFETYSTVSRFYLGVLPPQGSEVKLPPKQYEIPVTADVRDVAKAHVLALSAPATSETGHKRIIVGGPNFLWKDAVNYLAQTRPELKGRLPDASEALDLKGWTVDVSRARDVLGLKEFIPWKKTVDDSVDSILEIERGW